MGLACQQKVGRVYAWKLAILLTGPATGLETVVGQGERPFGIRHGTRVRARWSQEIWGFPSKVLSKEECNIFNPPGLVYLPVERNVLWAERGSTQGSPDGLWDLVLEFLEEGVVRVVAGESCGEAAGRRTGRL